MFAGPARSRLLPMSLPFRYFGAAAVFQVAAWSLLLLQGDGLSFTGGLGPLFAALHAVTLGVLAMSAIGASVQLLPVATRQPVRSRLAIEATWWLHVSGTAIFIAGGALYAPRVMGAGAALAVLAFGLYTFLLFKNLVGARGMPAVVAYGWGALASLLALAATGLALVARYEHGLDLDYPGFRAAHLVLAAYGFMGLLALGLSNFLLPMLALAPAPAARLAYAVLGGAVVAIVLAACGFPVVASLIGLATAAVHVGCLERSLRRRLRKPLGVSFLLVRVSWACLLASIATGGMLSAGLLPESGALLFGVLLVPGWLLTFLLGVMQRIVPFLGSVHASTTARGTPLITALTPARLLSAHAVLHLSALAVLLVAAVAAPGLVRVAGVTGLLAAAAYAAFFFTVLSRIHHHGIEPPHQPATA